MNITENITTIKSEIDTGKLANDLVCPLCGNTRNVSLLCELGNYSVYACKHCSFEFVFPVPDEATLKSYYDRKDWFEGGEKGGYENYDVQTAWSLELLSPVLEKYGDQKGLSILDVGCAYGSHLLLAAERDWKCFGVELSNHAREIAQTRLGNNAYIVETISDLIPHEFDLILMLDVIEHIPSPYTLFYELFSIGAITPKTRIIITTPNASSIEARRDPAKWVYRHPPSHLAYYTPESLSFLLRRLQFKDIDVSGLHPIADASDGLNSFAGLLVQVSGSNFTEFMRERYVPGTWSKIAEYEHMPRYALAKKLAAGKHVLDFGCGTGYGSAMLAESAASVTGLDIDAVAHHWARDCHHNSRLNFHLCDDLGATLPVESFDIATCFEMIEHVDHPTQRATIASISRLLRNDGVLLISTPNSEVTSLYGDNPYHLREMNEGEFLELLSEHFPYVTVLKQKVQLSISFENSVNNEIFHYLNADRERCTVQSTPLAFIAICSKIEKQDIQSYISLDNADYIKPYLQKENRLNKARFEAYCCMEKLHEYNQQLQSAFQNISFAHKITEEQTTEIGNKNIEIDRLNLLIEEQSTEIGNKNIEIDRLNLLIEEQSTEIGNKNIEIDRLNLLRAKELSDELFLLNRFTRLVWGRLKTIFYKK